MKLSDLKASFLIKKEAFILTNFRELQKQCS